MAKKLEELQESDVVFSDHYQNHQEMIHHSSRLLRNNKSKNYSSNNKKKRMGSSQPLNIPDSIFQSVDSDEQLEEEWDDEEMVPPHVIVGRRIAGKVAFSVCTGNGRTLKGRDLSQVRNSILRMTGFLET